MRKLRIDLKRMQIVVHPLLPLMLLVMAQLGAGHACVMMFACVLLHELGHLAAAMLSGVQAASLELMPMGGVVHISGLYRLPARAILLIAAAGPAVSLLLALVAVLLPQVFPLQFALMNLMLCAFNLLPGLPMDGGRMLAAALKGALGVRRSVRIAVRIGQGIGAALICTAAWLLLTAGGLSLPLLLMGVFLIACAGREAEDCELSPAEDLARLMSMNRMLQPLPVQAISCEKDIAPERLLRMLRPDRCTLLLWQGGSQWESDLDWLKRQFHV